MNSDRYRPSLLLLVLAILAFVATGCARDSAPELLSIDESSRRALPAGDVVGAASGTSAHVWRGIPYAKPPVGALRWRAPEPTAPSQDELAALESGSACSQYPMPLADGRDPDVPIGSEDCLFLNVHAPRHDPETVPTGDARHPVMVWIHGGANLTGETATYDWSRFAAKHGVVVVGMNYRLGPFGWFRFDALHGEGDDALDRSGNYGTLDLVRALEWVQENVGAFGGDPSNVTIFGESAGGNNVITLLLSEPARGLFHRAISQSGGTWSASLAESENWTDDETPGRPFSSREFLAALLIADGTVDSREAAKRFVETATPSELETYLRSQPAEAIMRVVADAFTLSTTKRKLPILPLIADSCDLVGQLGMRVCAIWVSTI